MFGPVPWPPLAELVRRWTGLQELMTKDGLDGALFFQNADLLYFCGTTQAEAFYLPREGQPLVLGRPPWSRLAAETPWTTPVPYPSRRKLKAVLETHGRLEIKVLGLESDVLPYNFQERLARESLAGTTVTDVWPMVRQLRATKSDYEIEQMRAAARAMDLVFQAVPGILATGVTEVELDGRLAGLARANGHQGLIRARGFNMEMYLGHVLSGPSGLIPAKVASPTGGTGIAPGFGQGAGPRLIGPGELVSVDLCGTHGGYIIDQARIFFTGQTPPRVRDVYARLLTLVADLNAFIRPGVLAGEVYAHSWALARKYGLEREYMTAEGQRCPFIGHGVGLELDEWPALAEGSRVPLAAGMTLAVEPRVFLPEFGVVGIEDTYLLTATGPEALTVSDRRIIEADLE